MKKKLICLLLCFGLLLSMLPAASAYYNTADWAAEAVESMESLGYLPSSVSGGDMTAPITRGEMCKMAVAMYSDWTGEEPYPASTRNFSDTKDPEINFAYERGIVGGYEDGTFRPDRSLTRQDFFVITLNLMIVSFWTDPTLELDTLERFKDSADISEYALRATQTMVSIGVVQGDGSRLLPKRTTTRQEAIAMFFRAYQYMTNWINHQTVEAKEQLLTAAGYQDLSSWAVDSVNEMYNLGMIPSCLDNCSMLRPITRAEMCAIAMAAYEKATGKGYTAKEEHHFTDTNDPCVNAAYELKIVGGFGDGTFGPDKTLTREQFFKLMANFMAALEYTRTDATSVKLESFTDGAQVADWAQAPARLLVYIGAVIGSDNQLNPQKNISIQETLTVFLRCYSFTVAWRTNVEFEGDPLPSILDEITAYARSFVGHPYVYGGAGPNTFDCSGFTMYIYKHFGISLPHGATSQTRYGKAVSLNELRPGDLVFFSERHNGTMNHVGMYLGDGYFIHAANPSRGVVIDSTSCNYYIKNISCARRYIDE